MKWQEWVVVAVVTCFTAPFALAQTKDSVTTTEQVAKKPPELTEVKGKLLLDDDTPVTGGLAFFVYQRRLMELPRAKTIEVARAMAEAAATVNNDGQFSLSMAPGNYALFYDPAGKADGKEALEPGSNSMAKTRRLSQEQLAQRRETIIANAKTGVPINQGRVDEGFIVENRQVRPPQVDFGNMILGINQRVTIITVKEDGQPVDFPVRLDMRGKNGDIYNPHPSNAAAPGKYVFFDVFPQFYEVFATAVPARPGATDGATTPTLKNNKLTFDGAPMEQKVTVIPGTQEPE
ncbi:MAG: hypothetical protein WCK47_09595 [bacterium]|nr:hypothetical protein [Candidatus Sumerlaeota bacterium]